MENNNYKVKYKEVRRNNTYKKALMLQNIFHELFLHKTNKEILESILK